jgi:protein-disulfide isomerase
VLQVEPELITHYVASGQVRLAFSHVLDHGERSLLAHKTAECAGQQSPLAFWQMHNYLFEHQAELWSATADQMAQIAGELGLDSANLRACLDDPGIAEKVTRIDQARRDRAIRVRPSFDINGQLLEGAAPLATFRQVLDQQLGQ